MKEEVEEAEKEMRGWKQRKGDMTWAAIAGFEDGKGPGDKDASSLQKLEEARTQIPRGVSGRNIALLTPFI